MTCLSRKNIGEVGQIKMMNENKNKRKSALNLLQKVEMLFSILKGFTIILIRFDLRM